MAIPIAAAFNVLLNERLVAQEEAAGEGPPDDAAAARDPLRAAAGASSPSAPEAEVRGLEPRDRG